MTDPRRSFERSLVVPEADIDELGHVNNTHYLRYMEETARAHAESLGAGLAVMRAFGTVPVARQHVITYHKPAHAGDTLTVRTEIIHSGGIRSTRRYEIRRGDTLLVEADTEWVWIDPDRNRPTRVPAALLEKFGW